MSALRPPLAPRRPRRRAGGRPGARAAQPAPSRARDTSCPPRPAPTPDAGAGNAAPAPATAEAARLDEIEQTARIALRKHELLEEEAAKRAKEAPKVTIDDKGFSIGAARTSRTC